MPLFRPFILLFFNFRHNILCYCQFYTLSTYHDLIILLSLSHIISEVIRLCQFQEINNQIVGMPKKSLTKQHCITLASSIQSIMDPSHHSNNQYENNGSLDLEVITISSSSEDKNYQASIDQKQYDGQSHHSHQRAFHQYNIKQASKMQEHVIHNQQYFATNHIHIISQQNQGREQQKKIKQEIRKRDHDSQQLQILKEMKYENNRNCNKQQHLASQDYQSFSEKSQEQNSCIIKWNTPNTKLEYSLTKLQPKSKIKRKLIKNKKNENIKQCSQQTKINKRIIKQFKKSNNSIKNLINSKQKKVTQKRKQKNKNKNKKKKQHNKKNKLKDSISNTIYNGILDHLG